MQSAYSPISGILLSFKFNLLRVASVVPFIKLIFAKKKQYIPKSEHKSKEQIIKLHSLKIAI